LRRREWSIEDSSAFRSVARWLTEYRPDLVLVSQDFYSTGVEWMNLCARLGLPYAIVLQAAAECIWPPDSVTAQLAIAYERAAARFFVSHGNLRLLRAILATPLHNSKVVRNPFNVSYDAAPPWPDESDGFRLACVGRLHPLSKGQDILLAVLASEKWKQRPLHVSLYGMGPNRAGLEYLKNAYGLDSVSFGGHTANVEEIWRAHHGLILPSRFEGLPLAAVEAMLCGRFCVVTKVAGNAELLDDNVTGFVAAAPATELLDEALERAWSRRAEWREIGQLAAKQVRSLVPRDPAREFAQELRSLVETPLPRHHMRETDGSRSDSARFRRKEPEPQLAS
jgi:glycosyltransferase involved in cell wall biosynthesis